MTAACAVLLHCPGPVDLHHGGRRQPMCDPEGCATVLGAEGGGDPSPPPWLTQTLGVGGLGGQPPGPPGGGGGGSVGTPTYIPQNDPHDTLIILNMWGKIFSKKRLPINSGSHQPRSDPEAGSGSKSFFVLFSHF